MLKLVKLTMLAWCASYIALAAMLATQHGEQKLLEGQVGGTVMLELFVHPETKSWTLIQRQTNGIGCVLATGSNLALAGEAPPVEQEN